MQIRQSALTQFGDVLVRIMRTAGEGDPDVKCSLDYMHSTYNNKKVLTLISPETGGQVLLLHEDPYSQMKLLVTTARIVNGDTKAWEAFLLEEDMGIRGKQNLALWLISVFKNLSYLDTDIQFVEKMTLLQKEDAVDLNLKSIEAGTFCTFYDQQYRI